MSKRTILAFLLSMATVPSALATSTWCAIIADTSDGFLALRGSPSAQAPILAKLPSGSYVEIDTAQCERSFDQDRHPLGQVCADPGWVAVEYAWILDVKPYDRNDHGGWVAERFLIPTECKN